MSHLRPLGHLHIGERPLDCLDGALGQDLVRARRKVADRVPEQRLLGRILRLLKVLEEVRLREAELLRLRLHLGDHRGEVPHDDATVTVAVGLPLL